MRLYLLFILVGFLFVGCADSGSTGSQNQFASEDTDQLPTDLENEDTTKNPKTDQTTNTDDNDDGATDDPEFAHSAKLTVMTYNINAIPCMRKNLLSGFLGLFGVDRCPTGTWESKNIDDRMKKLIDIIDNLKKQNKLPDVLLVQEAFRAKIFQVDDDAVNKLLDKSPYPHKAHGPEARIDNSPGDLLKSFFKHKGLLNSGLIIFSKYPIAGTDIVKFGNLCAQGICNAEKGIVYARIKVPGLPKTVDIYNTHLQSFTEEENIRKKQNEIMFDFMKKNEKSPWTIAGGDFNFKNTKAYVTFEQFIKGAKVDHAGLACLELSTCKLADGSKKKYAQGDILDHQFFASSSDKHDIEPKLVKFDTFKLGNKDLSDHHYKWVEYKLFWK